MRGVAIVMALGLAAGPAAACPEAEAVEVRALQSLLMVAALSCGGDRDYTTFVEKHRGALQDNAGRLRRQMSAARLDDVVTRIANLHSMALAEEGGGFCARAAAAAAAARDADDLGPVAHRHAPVAFAEGTCGGPR